MSYGRQWRGFEYEGDGGGSFLSQEFCLADLVVLVILSLKEGCNLEEEVGGNYTKRERESGTSRGCIDRSVVDISVRCKSHRSETLLSYLS